MEHAAADSSPEKSRRRLRQALRQRQQGDPLPLIQLLRRHPRLALPPGELAAALAGGLPQLPARLLHPSLLPAELLADPDHWQPATAGIDPVALQAAHPQLTHPAALLRSGLLQRILVGEAPLYPDLPPVAIEAYATQLRQADRRLCRQQQLSALAHLASHGWRAFRQGQSVSRSLDRFLPPPPDPLPPPLDQAVPQLLVVLEAEDETARSLAAWAGWSQVLALPSARLMLLPEALTNADPHTLVSFCHGSDQLDRHAAWRIAAAARRDPEAALLSSDETQRWALSEAMPPANRQCRVAITPLRLLCRGAIGGLVTLPAAVLQHLELPHSCTCLHALLLDLALQLAAQGQRFGHCGEVLLARDPGANPTLPDVATPRDRLVFGTTQAAETLAVLQRRAAPLLRKGGWLEAHPKLSGAGRLRYRPPEPLLISILIPFRDQLALTRACLESIQRHAGAVPYELVLIDNGSVEADTLAWLEQQQQQPDRTLLRLPIPFHYARLHNLARPHCRGDYLLLLNNDVEFAGPEVLARLLDPFAYGRTVAVGAQLHYPDGSLQHQGVMLVRGERRAVLEPGKHLAEAAVIETLTPLLVQEEFTATSAACLLIRAEDYDAVGGMDEQFAVTFNDVDLCLRLRRGGGVVVVTPEPQLIHHESISRGKDEQGQDLARQQREQGLLRLHHSQQYAAGDPLTSSLLHPHSNQYELRPAAPQPLGPVREQLVYSWRREGFRARSDRPLLVLAQYDARGQLRADLVPLLRAYQRYADVVLVAATSELAQQPQTLRVLRRCCQVVLVRRNEGYDFGSWMTALAFCRQELNSCRELILTNDSLWGPIRPLAGLFARLQACQAEVIGLTDNLLYEPHLQSAFMVYRRPALASEAFQAFWRTLQIWPSKRELVKHCEVGLPVLLRQQGLKLASLYSENACGNILHFQWRELIEQQGFPFLKVSLLRDNPTGQDISGWQDVVRNYNRNLAGLIARQLEA